ncbi:hypothetical protein PZB74_04495 [Porifericola rhodea]|uniref:hypothetical protein n=1 Tax=Porifericola rhodea TaxID=930972 RepID=UPI002666B199|nr:hypothetical protein [Porifericola rhodea]WKN32602.1 hypothetical protein PZB74_04495 [Porifericola rhodea]
MDEIIQIALFALFAIFSLVSNLLKKRKQQQAETRKGKELTEDDTLRPYSETEVVDQEGPRTPERPKTFEDIIRELSGGAESRKQREVSVPEQEEEEDDYEHPFSSARDRAREEARKRRQQVEHKAQSIEQFEGKVNKMGKQAVQRISDKITIDDKPRPKKVVIKISGKKSKSKNLARSVAASLKNPQSARKAIILSEILNKKHF